MGTRKRTDAQYNDTLRKLGFGLENPPDDFSDQPSSGGRIGGIRGKQEYGIEGGIAAQRDTEVDSSTAVDPQLLEAVEAASESLSEFSEEAVGEQEEPEEYEMEGLDRSERVLAEDLKSLIEDRLERNGNIHAASIKVHVEPTGLVALSGSVHSEAESLRVSEIAAALPGVLAIDNKLLPVHKDSHR